MKFPSATEVDKAEMEHRIDIKNERTLSLELGAVLFSTRLKHAILAHLAVELLRRANVAEDGKYAREDDFELGVFLGNFRIATRPIFVREKLSIMVHYFFEWKFTVEATNIMCQTDGKFSRSRKKVLQRHWVRFFVSLKQLRPKAQAMPYPEMGA